MTSAADTVRARFNVRTFGPGTVPILFAHGFGCDQNMWRFVTPAFAPDYRIVLFDYPGHGNSDRSAYDPAGYSTLDGYAARPESVSDDHDDADLS